MSSTTLGQMLIAAVEDGGRLWEIKHLIDDGAPLDETDTKGDTALVKAASKNDFELVEILLNAGCDPNIPDRDGNTALIRTIEFVKDKAAAEKIVDALLAHGASVTIENRDGNPAMHFAKQWRNYRNECGVYNAIFQVAAAEAVKKVVAEREAGKTPAPTPEQLENAAVQKTQHRNLRNYIKKGMKK